MVQAQQIAEGEKGSDLGPRLPGTPRPTLCPGILLSDKGTLAFGGGCRESNLKVEPCRDPTLSSRGCCQGTELVFQLFPGSHSKTIAQKHLCLWTLGRGNDQSKIDPEPQGWGASGCQRQPSSL